MTFVSEGFKVVTSKNLLELWLNSMLSLIAWFWREFCFSFSDAENCLRSCDWCRPWMMACACSKFENLGARKRRVGPPAVRLFVRLGRGSQLKPASRLNRVRRSHPFRVFPSAAKLSDRIATHPKKHRCRFNVSTHTLHFLSSSAQHL